MTELSPELLQMAFSKNSDSVALVADDRHLVANEAYISLFSYNSLEEIQSIPFSHLFPRNEQDRLTDYLMERQGESGTHRSFRTTGVRKDSTVLPVELSASSCGSEPHMGDLFLIAILDNTDNCRIEEELQKSRRSLAMIKQCHQILLREEREQTFMEKTCTMISETKQYDLIWYSLKKNDGTICTASYRDGRKEIGSPRALLISTKCMTEKETVQCNDIGECLAGYPEEKGQLQKSGYKSLISLPLILGDQAVGSLNIYSESLNTFEGDRENLESLVDDICYGIKVIRMKEKETELERQLLQAQKMETIGTLAGGIAHDFNNIMTPILGYSEMILSRLDSSDPLYSYNQQILKGAVRAKELVKQILDFSHKENHRKEALFIDRIVKEALQLMSSLIPKTISIHKHIKRNCGKILADPAQIHQVIANLCTNAFHAMEERGGHLTIELTRINIGGEMKNRYPELKTGDYAQVIIGDTGKGMNRETKNRIFEPFFTTKPVGKGTGLGLSVVHGIMKNHQGAIAVESEIGLGTVFRLFFPLINDEHEEETVEKERCDPAEGRIILLLDDHRDITELLKIMMMNCGYTVEAFVSSESALESYRKHPASYSLIVSDLHMPGINGLEFLREIRSLRDDLPALIITGHEEQLSEREKRKYNIREIIHKPILRNSFVKAVTKCLKEEKR